MGFLLLGALVLLYLALVALAFLFQNRLIYPAPAVQSQVPAGYERVRYITADGIELAAGWRRAAPGRPTLLFFHGNGADWQSTAFVTARLASEGYGVLAAEYRGYGGNPGAPTEKGLYEDGRAAWAFLRDQNVTAEDIVLLGNSLGSGVATHLATEVNPAALVLISPFDSLEETASRAMRWLPVRQLIRDRYDNVGKIPHITAPVLILHGEEDTLISLPQVRALARTREDVELVTYAGWGHELVMNEAVQDRIARFLSRLDSSAGGTPQQGESG